MLLMKILFIMLIIICAAFYILYIWDFSLILLIVIASLPIIMFLIVFSVKRRSDVSFAVKSTVAAKDESFNIQLCIENRSIFPIGKAEAVIEYYNIFNGCKNNIELHFPIQPRNQQRVTFRLTSKFCGRLRIRCAYINIFDPLRIFRFRIGKNISQDIMILPEGQEIGGCISNTDCVEAEGLVFSEHRSGDDPTEVFDLREYNPGDRLNRIHWKLSSKKDEFIVKEYSCPVDSPAVILLDLCCNETSELRLPIYDTLLELCVSLSHLFIEEEHLHTIVYYNCAEKSFVSRDINGMDTLSAVINELIASIDDKVSAVSPTEYFNEPPNRRLTSFTLITNNYSDADILAIDETVDADIKNAVAVTVDGISELPEEYSSVNIIPVVVGKISSSVRAIEL